MKGGDLTPIYELVVAMLTQGERTTWFLLPAIHAKGWWIIPLYNLHIIAIEHRDRKAGGSIRMESQLGRAILAAW